MNTETDVLIQGINRLKLEQREEEAEKLKDI